MFSFFRAPEPPSPTALAAALADKIAAQPTDKDAAFSLRQLAQTSPEILPDLAQSLPGLLAKLGESQPPTEEDSELEDRDQALQAVLECYFDSLDKTAPSQSTPPPSVALLGHLLDWAAADPASSSPAHQTWVRVASLSCLDALASLSTSSSSSFDFTSLVLKVPNSLQSILTLVEDPVPEVADSALALLLRVSPHEQVKAFITFADGFQLLVRIAHDSAHDTASALSSQLSALSVVFNTVKQNPPGQRQFCDSPLCLSWLSAILLNNEASPALRSLALDIVRQLTLSTPCTFQQTRLGATPGLLDGLYELAKQTEGDLVPLATRTLGDLVAGHGSNTMRLLELGIEPLISLHCTSATARTTMVQASAHLWTCVLQHQDAAVGLVGHSIAPPPDSSPSADCVGFLSNELVSSARRLLGVRSKLYVDPEVVSHSRLTLWRCCRLLEGVLSTNPLAAEVGLKLRASSEEDEPLLWVLLETARAMHQSDPEETKSVADACSSSALQVVRLLLLWCSATPAVCVRLLDSPACLFVFEQATVATSASAPPMLALLLLCLVTHGGPVAATLAEQKSSIEDALSLVKSAVLGSVASVVEATMAEGEAGPALVDARLAQLAARLVAHAGRAFVQGHGSLAPASSASIGAESARVVELEKENKALKAALSLDVRALLKEHAELLLVLAHQEMDRQALLQQVLQLGGQQALDEALERSSQELAKALTPSSVGAAAVQVAVAQERKSV